MDGIWDITRKAFNLEQNLSDEGLFTQGTGYFHVRGALEEPLPDNPQNLTYMRIPGNVTVEKRIETHSKWGTYIPGIFGKHPLINNEMINLPHFLGIKLTVEDETFNPKYSVYKEYEKILNLRNSVIIRKFKWIIDNISLDVKFERFADSVNKHLFIQRLTVFSDSETEITVKTFIDADVRTSGYDHFTDYKFKEVEEGIYSEITTDLDKNVGILSEVTSNINTSSIYAKNNRIAELEKCFELRKGKKLVFEKRTALVASNDLEEESNQGSNLQERAKEFLDKVELYSYLELLNKHSLNMEERWDKCDVNITGDDKAQLAIRISLYHLLRSHVPNDNRVTIDAKGYAGDAYFGRFFWDTEMYMLPFYLYTDPERAKNFTDFRIQTLPGAIKNAQRYGYKGAKYPWESDFAGDEGCPAGNWQYSDHELHVTGAVAYGLAHYSKAVDNEDYLIQDGKDVLLETARYWFDRVDRRKGDDHQSLLGVMGPDEYTPISSNNTYTNQMAKYNLELAVKYCACSEDEKELFIKTAAELPILKKNDLVLQCEEFETLAEPDFEKTWKDRTKPYGANVHQEKLYRTKCLKQADVLMMMFLFPNLFSYEELKTSWEYYVPYCTHDSSLSGGIHSILASKLSLKEEAVKFWDRCSFIDLDDGASQGIHIANCASDWMVAVFGFAGVKSAMESDVFCLNPCLPDKWEKLEFPFIWKGSEMYVIIKKNEVCLRNKSCRDIKVLVAGKEYTVNATSAFHLDLENLFTPGNRKK